MTAIVFTGATFRRATGDTENGFSRYEVLRPNSSGLWDCVMLEGHPGRVGGIEVFSTADIHLARAGRPLSGRAARVQGALGVSGHLSADEPSTPSEPAPAPAAARVNLSGLSVLSYTQGFTLWVYRAGADGPGAVLEPGYWDGAGDSAAAGDDVPWTGSRLLRTGDRIVVTAERWSGDLWVVEGGTSPQVMLLLGRTASGLVLGP